MKNKGFCAVLKAKNVNEKALVAVLGITGKDLRLWKSGKVRPHILYVKEMSKLFEMNLEELWRVFK